MDMLGGTKRNAHMQNHHTADGSRSIFISICTTLGNFGKNMLMHTFLSDTEMHKAPLSVVNELCIPQAWISGGNVHV